MPTKNTVQAGMLDAESFKPYGVVMDAPSYLPDKKPDVSVNGGIVRRFNRQATLQNKRSADKAPCNVCLFSCAPTCHRAGTFTMTMLERHFYSTQAFVPMGAPLSQEYLVVVAHNDPKTDRPDLSTLQVTIATGAQAIQYHPGVWHHPLVAIGADASDKTRMDFFCLVHEDGGKDDTHITPTPSIDIVLPAKVAKWSKL